MTSIIDFLKEESQQELKAVRLPVGEGDKLFGNTELATYESKYIYKSTHSSMGVYYPIRDRRSFM